MSKKYINLIIFVSILVIAIVATILVVYFNSIEKGTNFKLGDYTVISQGSGVALVSYDGEETEVSIPYKIEGKKIVAIKEGAFNNSSVVKITCEENPDLVLEDSVFNNNSVLQEVVLPANMKSIPKNCFMNCTSLLSVTIPSGVTYIGNYAFYACSNLTKNYEVDENGYRWLELPEGLTDICNSAFYNCTALDCVRVSSNLKVIGEHAFRASGLQKIALYEDSEEFGITSIGKYAFYSSYLYSNSSELLRFPALTTIGEYAFASTSTNFKQFNIPCTVTSIGDYAFSGSSSLTTLVFESDEEGDKDLTLGKYLVASCTSLESVEFRRDVDTIPEGTFMGCIKLLYNKNLVLPETVQEIGPGAFAFFVTQSSNTKYCNYKVVFKHTDAKGEETTTSYNNFFRVSELQRYDSSTLTSQKHYVLTDYDITELYAYIGLYSTSSTWQYDEKTTSSFKFLLSEEYIDSGTSNPKNFSTIATIHNSAFAGAQFDSLCLPGATTTIEKNALYQSSINLIYIDADCLDRATSIDSEALSNAKTEIKEMSVLIVGNKTQSKAFETSSIKEQFDAIYKDICYFTTLGWPN